MNTQEIADYLNTTVLVKLAPSKIHGIGVFAVQDISAGTALYPMPIQRFYNNPKDVLPLLRPQVRTILLQRQSCRSVFEHPNTDANYQAFMNHSDNANATHGRHATRDIKAGEEITEDYTAIGCERPV